MIEVFKTNVTSRTEAQKIVDKFNREFTACKSNFDLHDHDNILRIVCQHGILDVTAVIDFMKQLGFKAEVLCDEISQSLITETADDNFN